MGISTALFVAHDLGLPKEVPLFWEKLQQVEPFNPQRTLFVNDSPSVLASARRYGIRWLLRVLKPDTGGRLPGSRRFSGDSRFL